jgi:hypothetical protein
VGFTGALGLRGDAAITAAAIAGERLGAVSNVNTLLAER